MAGRPRIPDELKLRKGTLNVSRYNKEQLSTDDLTLNDLRPPTYFNKYAKKFYMDYGKVLIDLGVMKQTDTFSFEALASQVGIYLEALYDIKENGMYQTGTNKNGSTYRMQNPSINISNSAYKNIQVALSKLGLTPADRSRVVMELKEVISAEVDIKDFLN
jgi:P27 family predicted phage terminase small subunit